MSKPLTKTAYYPRNTSLHESLAAKVITRVVSDGISLRNAVREAIKVAELNKKDIFLLLSVLQDFGMVQNGDYKNYWSNGWGEGIGTEGVDANQGTNYYASSKGKVVTANQEKMFQLFDQIEKLRAFATDEEIISENPELEPVIASMNKTQKFLVGMGDLDSYDFDTRNPGYLDIDTDELESLEEAMGVPSDVPLAPRKPAPDTMDVEKLEHFTPWDADLPSGRTTESFEARQKRINEMRRKREEMERGVEPKGMAIPDLSSSFAGRITVAIGENEAGGLEELPGAVPAAAPEAAPAGELTVEEPEAPTEDLTVEEPEGDMGGQVEVKVSLNPQPHELMSAAKEGPQWEIDNNLSLQRAENYYTELKKQIDAINLSTLFTMTPEDTKPYNEVAEQIEAELSKIKEAIKGKEQIDKKKNKLEEEVAQPELEVEEIMGPEPTQKAEIEPTEGIEEAEPTTEGV